MESGVALRFPPQSKTLGIFAKHPLAQLGEGQRDSRTGNFFWQSL
jgi:hypothetical protein